MGLPNKSADENDIKEIRQRVGQKTLNILTLFRVDKKVDSKIRLLKIVLDSKFERKFLLENARNIEAKVPREIFNGHNK